MKKIFVTFLKNLPTISTYCHDLSYFRCPCPQLTAPPFSCVNPKISQLVHRVAYHIERIGSYHDHKADISIAIKMTDEQYF